MLYIFCKFGRGKLIYGPSERVKVNRHYFKPYLLCYYIIDWTIFFSFNDQSTAETHIYVKIKTRVKENYVITNNVSIIKIWGPFLLFVYIQSIVRRRY